MDEASDSRSTVYIALGSNLGDREAYIQKAYTIMAHYGEIDCIQMSPIVETEPVGGPKTQSKYLNSVAEIRHDGTPQELLSQLHSIEVQLGRTRDMKWGPRTIDLDILLYGDLVLNSPELTIPHPHMHERLFVLEPLVQIAPEAVHPTTSETIEKLFHSLKAYELSQSNDSHSQDKRY